MSTHYKRSCLLFLITFLLWCLTFFSASEVLTKIMLFLSANMTVATFIFFVVAFVKKRMPEVSAFRIFTIADGIVWTLILLYAIYDMSSLGNEWSEGYLGLTLLIFVVPVTVLMLVGNFIVCKIQNPSG